jgi:hypothetical protein
MLHINIGSSISLNVYALVILVLLQWNPKKDNSLKDTPLNVGS